MEQTTPKKVVNTHYRSFTSEIQVFRNEKLLFTDILDISDFSKPNRDPDFWDHAVLQYVWLDEFESTYTKLSFHCTFQKANSNAFKAYKIYFDKLGQKEIELIETS